MLGSHELETEPEMNNTHKLMMVAFFSASALSLGVTGCAREESRAETRQDVAKAQAEGRKDVAEERRDAAEERSDAQRNMNASGAEGQQETAEGNREIALAKAEADHKVAVERCEALSGTARSNCKDDAGAALEVAQAQAEAEKLAADPKN
jgi:hypothetical protein